MWRQLRNCAFRYVLCRVKRAADSGGVFGRGGTGSARYGDGRFNRHAGSRELDVGLARVEADANGEPAHDLGEIAGRVVRGRDRSRVVNRPRVRMRLGVEVSLLMIEYPRPVDWRASKRPWVPERYAASWCAAAPCGPSYRRNPRPCRKRQNARAQLPSRRRRSPCGPSRAAIPA